MKIDVHFQDLIPAPVASERALLERSLREEGCRDALVVWAGNGTLLDGHNRYQICTAHNIPFRTQEIELPDRKAAIDWIIRNQLGRRNLNESQRAMLAARALPVYAQAARERLKEAGRIGGQSPAKGRANLPEASDAGRARDDAAATVNVSPRSVESAKKVIEAGTPSLVSAVERGELPVSVAVEIATVPKERQEEILATAQGKDLRGVARRIQADRKRSAQVQQILSTTHEPAALGAKRYPVICADPPWQYEHSETISRDIENHYPTMSLDDICALPVAATDDAVLFLWTTSPKLEEGLRVMHEWGFSYRTCAVWDKEKIGMGYWFRQQHELILVGVRGKFPPPAPEHRPPSVIREARGLHSEKPDCVYAQIETMWPELPKLEMFARGPREGWDVWGNQAGA